MSISNSLGTQHYKNTSGTTGDNWTYGTPTESSITIGSGLAAGGTTSAQLSCSTKDTKKYYRKYTSGTYTLQYIENPASTITWTIDSQSCAGGTNRYSISGTTLSHTTMAKNTGVDTVTVKATNANSTSKYGTKSTSVTNTLTWGNVSVSVSSPSTPYTMSAAGETKTISASTGTQTGTYTSGSTDTFSPTLGYDVTTSKDGFSLINTNQVKVTNNASTSARNGFVVTVTATGKTGTDSTYISGYNKTATSDRTFNQAAGSKVYANPTVTGYYYANFAAAGVSNRYPTVTYTQAYTWNGVSGSGSTDSYTYDSSHTSPGGTRAFTAGTLPTGFTKGTSFASTGKIGRAHV